MKARKTLRRRDVPEGAEALLPRVPAVLRRVYAARGVREPSELTLALSGLLPPSGLQGIGPLAAVLADAVQAGQSILVVGDFDADGATSTALVLRALRRLGATRVDYLVPNRFEYGYGLTPEIVAVAATRAPDLILTVDNGVTSVAGVDAARALGIRVVVTDHHLPGACLPKADAMINPNLPGDTFASKALAGVGVAFYAMAALRGELRARGWFTADRPEPNLAELLDLVALGTVADVVPLDRNNRALVAQGLARIRSGRAAPGILSLFAVAGRDPRQAVASDLGFAIGPRLNAAGRLDDMSLGIECLLTDDPRRAREWAERLDELNRERREIETDMQARALEQLGPLLAARGWSEGQVSSVPEALVLFDADWHPGVIGILAGRLKERLHRPVIVLAQEGEEGEGLLRGSARSIPGLHLRDALEVVDARHPGLILRFGGHAMAAGLTLHREALESFTRCFTEVVRESVEEADLQGVLLSDGELAAEDITLELAQQLREGGPWGQHFPEPLFDGVFEVAECRAIGHGRHQRLVLTPPGEPERRFEAVLFNHREDELPGGRFWRVAYRLDVNVFRGSSRCQLVLEHVEAA